MADRQRGVQIHRGIIYGSHARLLSEAEKQLAPPGHTHRWSVFLTSATSPPPKAGEAEDMDYIPGGADDLTYMLKKVTFRLHETYPNPSRALDKPPYIVTETGWGEFTVGIRIQFVPEANEKPITLQHPIKLHHWGAPVEPPVLAIAGPTPSASASAAPTPAATVPADPAPATEAKKDTDGDVKMEVATPGGGDAQPAEPSTSGTASADQTGGSEAEGDVITALRPDRGAAGDASRTEASTPAPVSIAAKMPVHAWQYDELIFYDPPLIFYNILNDHPPTPLPARNRRPRDQREMYTQNKKKKGRVSAVASSSRANTPARTESGSIPPATTVPAAGESVGVGIPGEPGSADVPLEFTAEMEKGEWNRLHDARKKIIDEMDRWRMKLIEEEKELQKLKEEMAAMAATPALG